MLCPSYSPLGTAELILTLTLTNEKKYYTKLKKIMNLLHNNNNCNLE